MNIIFLCKELYIYRTECYSSVCSIFDCTECYFSVCSILGGIILLGIFISIGLLGFIYIYSTPNSNKTVCTVVKKNNTTDQFYFGYFSLFVLLFMSFDFADFMNLTIFGVIFLVLAVVYCRNNLFYINPTINLLGRRIFHVQVKYNTITQEFYVITYEDITIGQNYIFFISPYEFTVCKKLDSNINNSLDTDMD